MDDQQLQPETPDRVTVLEQQAQEHLDGWKRAKADYLNLKKQTDQEKVELASYATAQTVLSFLPIYDNLKRAFKHIPEDQRDVEWVKGLVHILKQFEDSLLKFQITPIATIGLAFDPIRHHAVSRLKQDGAATDTILEEVKSGFMMGDRVIEPAQVVVAE